MLGGLPGYSIQRKNKDLADMMVSDQNADQSIGVCLNMPGLIQQQKKMCTKWPETVQ